MLVPLLGTRDLHSYTLRCFHHAISETLVLPKDDAVAKRRRIDAAASVAVSPLEPPVSVTSPLLELVLVELRDGDASVLDSIASFIATSTKDDAMRADAATPLVEGPSADSCATMLEQLAVFEAVVHLCARPNRHADQLRTLLDTFRLSLLQPLTKVSLARLCAHAANVSLLKMVIDLCLLCVSVGPTHEALLADVCAFLSLLLSGLAEIPVLPPSLEQLLTPALACLAITPLNPSLLAEERKRLFAVALRCTCVPVAAAAVRYLPMFVHNTVSTEEHSEQFVLPFLPLLSQLADSECVALAEAVAHAIGSLACVAAGTSVCVLESIRHPVAFKITCRCCSVSFLRSRACQSSASAIPAGAELSWAAWQPFMSLLKHAVPSEASDGAVYRVRIAFAADSMVPYVVHCVSQRLIPTPALTQGTVDGSCVRACACVLVLVCLCLCACACVRVLVCVLFGVVLVSQMFDRFCFALT